MRAFCGHFLIASIIMVAALHGESAPLVIGHRGFAKFFPENTLLSFQEAFDTGNADGVEADLHVTKDGVVVVLHDNTLDRTTNCTGPVSEFTYTDLRICNANYQREFGDQFGFQPIPTFIEVLQLVHERRKFIVMDLKNQVCRSLLFCVAAVTSH